MGGHDLLLKYLKKDKNLKGKILVEIGTVREYFKHQNSTLHLSQFADGKEMHFITVDMDPENTDHAVKLFEKNNLKFEAVNMKGEDYLEQYEGTIDYIYLDAFDFDHGKHSEKRKNKYKEHLKCSISNQLCWEMHLKCCKSLVKILSPDGMICFDDILNNNTYEGKGKLAVPYLLENGFEKVEYGFGALILKRTK